ncbi:helix-turn-helix domain-containing protein [Streptomyces sp. NPDC047002]|uniref:TetR/AcrR family transcriptional regulator n=1 Tax=Streptomyces sp. NPDC047002 TaxID=3155475 RepID=UPI0034540D64
MTRKPRTDAELNRRRILATARAAFAGEGLDVPMREIARRAGLGTATVHRHFPARTDLVAAALAELVAECRADMRALLAEPDPWRALGGAVRRFAEHRVHDRGLDEALFGSHPAAASFAADRRAQERAMRQLVDRAREAGAVRRDVTVEDVRVCLGAIASFRPARSGAALGRLVELLLIGLAADDGPARGTRARSLQAPERAGAGEQR